METGVSYVLFFVYAFIYLSNLITNPIMMVGLWKTNRRFLRPQKLYFCLCISDMLVGTANLPVHIIHLTDNNIYTCEFIALETFLGIFTVSISMLIMLSIVIDRYLLITKTIFYNKHIADQRIVIMIAANIVIAFVLSVAAATISYSSYEQVGVSNIAIGLYLILLITVMAMLNYILIKYVRNVARNTRRNTGIRGNYTNRVTVSVIILSIVMIICYLPAALGNLISGIYTYRHDRNLAIAYYNTWTTPLLFLNTTINSIVYVKRNTAIKNYVRKTVRRPKLQTNITMNAVSTIVTNNDRNGKNTQYTDQL